MASDDKEYEQSALGKRVNELMDDGYDFGEAVKQAMSEGLKDGGSVGIEILFGPKREDFNIGGNVQRATTPQPYDSRATVADFARAIDRVGAGTDLQKAMDIQRYGQNVQMQNMRGMGKSGFQTQPGTLSQGLGKIANDAVIGSMNLYGLDPSKAGVAQDPSMLEYKEIKEAGLPQKDYAAASTYGMLEDMTEGNAFKRALAGTAGIAAVPLTYLASPIYDTAQAGYRAATNPDLNFLQALKNEKVGEMMNARTKGALQFVGDQFGLTNNRQDIVDSITKTPTYDSASAGAIITDGDSKYRINADGSRSLIGKIEDAPIIDRPTMADVAGPKEGYISLKE